MNINFMVTFLHLRRIWYNCFEFWPSMLFNFVLVWHYYYFDLSVTDESYVDRRASDVLNNNSGTLITNYIYHVCNNLLV